MAEIGEDPGAPARQPGGLLELDGRASELTLPCVGLTEDQRAATKSGPISTVPSSCCTAASVLPAHSRTQPQTERMIIDMGSSSWALLICTRASSNWPDEVRYSAYHWRAVA